MFYGGSQEHWLALCQSMCRIPQAVMFSRSYDPVVAVRVVVWCVPMWCGLGSR